MNDLAFDAMIYAREIHKDQVRKYTGNPYTDHLAEVAGIVATVATFHTHNEVTIATAWLHDSIEDCGVDRYYLGSRFCDLVSTGVQLLSDVETGNRAQRKEASRKRLEAAPGWVQSIKVADLISNTSSIVQHDPAFAKIYLEEKRLMLAVLKKADRRLLEVAHGQVNKAISELSLSFD